MNNNIENEIFKKTRFDIKKLLNYGFKYDNNKYFFVKNILNDTFRVEINIDNNLVKGQIWDLKINDLYTNYRLDSIGEFASKIKNKYINILNDIKNKCCNISYFENKQTNKMCNYIINTYQDYPEFMWEKYPGYGVFKNKVNKKWYAVILNINKSKLDKEDKEVEIINLKVEPTKIEELLKKDNYYAGYHMNKKNWISIILDDKVSSKEIQILIDNAYKLIEKSGK